MGSSTTYLREGSKRGELVNRRNRGMLEVNETVPECDVTSGQRSPALGNPGTGTGPLGFYGGAACPVALQGAWVLRGSKGCPDKPLR